jgi:hypothetical protein
MTAAEQGKFCNNCQKVVYDFSDKTEEYFNLISKNNNGEICGRFREDQINQDHKYIAAFKRNPIIDRFRKAASFLITLATLKIASIREGFSQSEVNNTKRTEIVSYDSDRRMDGSVEIRGQVQVKKRSEYGIEGAFVKLYDAKGKLVECTFTKENGCFYLKILSTIKLDQTFLIVVEKRKEKTFSDITRYTRDKKKITQKDFTSVVLSMDMHSKSRIDLFRRKRRVIAAGSIRRVE